MVKQEDAMQLIGEWGFTPKRLAEYVASQRLRAKEIGDKAGLTAYSSLLTLCRFAMSGNSIESVREDGEDFNNKLRDELNAQLMEMQREHPEFADEVIDKAYQICLGNVSFRDAEIAVRREVVFSIVPLVIAAVTSMGVKASEQILECMIGLDAIRIDKGADALDETAIPVENMRKFSQTVMAFKGEMRACTETENSDFNELFASVMGDVDAIEASVSQNMLSIIDRPPHEWVRYATDFGKMMTGFVMAMSLGYVTYDDYDTIIEIFKMLRKSEHKSPKIMFGRN